MRAATLSLLLTLLPALAFAQSPPVTPPPDSFFSLVRERDREAARTFYKKYINVNGMPVVAADVVADRALQRTYDIVTHLLAGRPDIVRAMADNGMYLIIIGRDQVYTDMPEYRGHPNPAYQNERVRGTGGKPTSFGEENLLSLQLDRYDDESIGVHEFCHTIDGALRSLDPTWSDRKNAVFQNTRETGLWHNTYAGSNAGEYWAEICQSYFDCNRVNNWNHGPIGTREQLRACDPAGYELVRTAFRLSPDQDWRYSYEQQQPSITSPPAKFNIDPYYTKFTWAREFTVVGRGASDQALLKANDTIRKLFAYRHDILKGLMADGLKLVVLGRDEKISDLPEFKQLADKSSIDALSRTLEYTPALKLLVAAEENILADPRQPNIGDNQVIRAFATAIYGVTGTRPVDPDWEKRPRNIWQQYELRVQRLDTRFADRLRALHEKSLAAGNWKGTSAAHDSLSYWTAGLLAYFDARGQDASPSTAGLSAPPVLSGADRSTPPHPILTRGSLHTYDPDLFALVHETMSYQGHVDWRLK